MKNVLLFKIGFLFFLTFFLNTTAQEVYPAKDYGKKIKVLNMATFHMGRSSDSNTTNYDETSEKNKHENWKIAKSLAAFKATVVAVEREPAEEEQVNADYQRYLQDHNTVFKNPGEIELLAFEVARLNNVKKIYCIDHQMPYNYFAINALAHAIKAETYLNYMKGDRFPDDPKMSTLQLLKYNNLPEYLADLVTFNADIMTHVSTKDNYEGADVAAKFYQRNLRMYGNLNRIPLNENDRIFILMGSTHTAFFNIFMKSSPRYELVNIFNYLK